MADFRDLTMERSQRRLGAALARVHVRTVAAAPDPQLAYTELFAGAPHSFWLDSSAVIAGFSRFSMMGDDRGRAEGGDRGQRRAPIGHADAAMIFADRAVLFDHVEGACYLLCLGPDPPCEEVTTWLDTMSLRLRSLPSVSPPDTRLEMVAPRDVPLQVELRHDKDAYLKRIAHCLREIDDGECYEVCLTNTATVVAPIDPLRTYRYLRRISPVPYGALLYLGSLAVLSASPERFVTIDAQRVVESGPIEGTRPPGCHSGGGSVAARGPGSP